ncbi:MAG TPA: LuxR family transcriptional regulator [Candidatus Bathyarchaeia archaeon]|nr:LuxR family transcriptional regulator [Candidatus Bathyarchaeia archaeon]
MPIQRPLTPRQRVILRSVARGKTNKDIAAELGISEQGVKVHISRLLERYGAENRVELIGLTRSWPDPDEPSDGDLSRDLDGIRAGLNKSYDEATAVAEMHGGNGHSVATAAIDRTNGHLRTVRTNLATEVRSLREVLSEINVALKLARELPADADVGPLVDAIRTRVGAALEQSARLDALVDDGRSGDRRARQTAH